MIVIIIMPSSSSSSSSHHRVRRNRERESGQTDPSARQSTVSARERPIRRVCAISISIPFHYNGDGNPTIREKGERAKWFAKSESCGYEFTIFFFFGTKRVTMCIFLFFMFYLSFLFIFFHDTGFPIVFFFINYLFVCEFFVCFFFIHFAFNLAHLLAF